jgi:hypothetical protein
MLPVAYSDVTASSAKAATTTCTIRMTEAPKPPTACFSASSPGSRWVLLYARLKPYCRPSRAVSSTAETMFSQLDRTVHSLVHSDRTAFISYLLP